MPKNQATLRRTLTTPLLSMTDVIELLNVCRSTVEAEINSGRLTPIWIRGTRRFRDADVARYIEECLASGTRDESL